MALPYTKTERAETFRLVPKPLFRGLSAEHALRVCTKRTEGLLDAGRLPRGGTDAALTRTWQKLARHPHVEVLSQGVYDRHLSLPHRVRSPWMGPSAGGPKPLLCRSACGRPALRAAEFSAPQSLCAPLLLTLFSTLVVLLPSRLPRTVRLRSLDATVFCGTRVQAGSQRLPTP